MDPSDSQSHSQEHETPKRNGVVFVILRWALAILFPFLFFLSITIMLGLLAYMFADFSIPNPISLPSQCKIVSTGVDIRSSKVEYKDHFSGQTQVAFAEAPNEALPLYCRPNFGAAWLTQYKFKVNKTYDCWYTSGISKVRLHQDNIFGCDAHEPSTLEKSRQYSTMAMEMVISWLSARGRTKRWRWEALAGVVTGFLTSLISITFIRVLQLLLSSLYHSFTKWIFPCRANAILIRRTCFLLAYLSFVAWLAIEYGKKLGLIDLFRFPKS